MLKNSIPSLEKIFDTQEKYGLSSVDQAQNRENTRRRFKLTRYGYSKIISTQIHVECLREVLKMI
jgi:hypothetical protein